MEKLYNNPTEGDWVRFYLGSKLIIACVQYITEQKYYPFEKQLYTDKGKVNVCNVLEARPKIQEPCNGSSVRKNQ